MLDLGSDRENDTEAYTERYFTSIWCLCSIERATHRARPSCGTSKRACTTDSVSRETMTDMSLVLYSSLAWCYYCFRSTTTRARLAVVGVRRQSILCALHRTAAAPYIEDILAAPSGSWDVLTFCCANSPTVGITIGRWYRLFGVVFV